MLGGIVCPMLSPVRHDGRIDVPAATALVHGLVEAGIDALLVAGTTGDFQSLDDRAWSELVETAVGQIGNRVPAIVNVSHCGLRVAIERARIAARVGAGYITSTPPYYVPLDGDATVTFFHQLAEASTLPLILYNIPQFTQGNLTPLLPRLASHPNIIGIKDSSGLYEGMAAIPQRIDRQFVRLAGTDVLLPASVAQGLDGVVPGLSNVVPALYHLWWRALRQGDSAYAGRLEAAVRRLTSLYDAIPGSAPYMHLFRFGLHLRGIACGSPSGLHVPLDERVQEQLKTALDEADRLVEEY